MSRVLHRARAARQTQRGTVRGRRGGCLRCGCDRAVRTARLSRGVARAGCGCSGVALAECEDSSRVSVASWPRLRCSPITGCTPKIAIPSAPETRHARRNVSRPHVPQGSIFSTTLAPVPIVQPDISAPAEQTRQKGAQQAHLWRVPAARAVQTAEAAIPDTPQLVKGRQAATPVPQGHPVRHAPMSRCRARLAPTQSRVPLRARSVQLVFTALFPRRGPNRVQMALTRRMAPHRVRTAQLVRSARLPTRCRLVVSQTKCRPRTR